jgi:peptidoglycan-associated lipoprotein
MSRTVLHGVVSALIVVAVAACSHPRPAPAPAAAPPPAVEPAPPAPPPPPVGSPAPPPPALTEDEVFARKTVEELNAEQPLADVFFDYDSSDLRAADRDTLQKHVEWLNKWPSVQVAVEGHCDSRGTAEYNIALGDRRAAAVKSYLVSLGVDSGRVRSVSLGKEQPFCHEESEPCWQQNRRGHFLITAK